MLCAVLLRVCMYVCVCVCVCERERERERQTDRERETHYKQGTVARVSPSLPPFLPPSLPFTQMHTKNITRLRLANPLRCRGY